MTIYKLLFGSIIYQLTVLMILLNPIELSANTIHTLQPGSANWVLTIQCPDDITVECPEDIPPVDVNSITFSDTCGGVTIKHIGDVSDGNSCPEVITRTYQLEDSCGNVIDCHHNITIEDIIAPMVSEPADITFENCSIMEALANSQLLPYSVAESVIAESDLLTEGITASDNCKITGIKYFDQQVGEYCPIVVLRTFHIWDGCGNLSVIDYTIVVQDTYAPVFREVPEDITAYCDEIPEPPDVTAKDNCSCASWIFYTELSNTVEECEGEIVRQWVAEDDCGNAETITQTITVIPSTTSVDQISNLKRITIFPNPSNGVISVDVYSLEMVPLLVEIKDMGGREIFTRSYSAGSKIDKMQIDLHNNPPGVYFLRLIADTGVITKRIILRN